MLLEDTKSLASLTHSRYCDWEDAKLPKNREAEKKDLTRGEKEMKMKNMFAPLHL